MNGGRIKRARLERGWTLAYVARETGYTPSFISQIERNLRQPSLAALRKIADCFGQSPVWLLVEEGSEPAVKGGDGLVIRAAERATVTVPEIAIQYEVVTPPLAEGSRPPRMTGLYLRLKPGLWVTEKMICHLDADESIFVLEGALDAQVGEAQYRLEAGDNLYIPEGALHNYQSVGSTDLVALLFFSKSIL